MSIRLSPRLERSHFLFLWLLPSLLLFSRAIADTTLVLISLIFLFRTYRNKDWGWAKQGWFRLALLFWLYLICLNLPMSQFPDESLKNVLAFIRWPLFAAALAYWFLAKRAQQWTLLKGLLITCLFVVLDTSWQYVFDVDWFGIERFNEERLTGPFRSPVPGTLMLRVWFITMFAVLFWQWIQNRPKHQVVSLPLMFLLFFGFTFITGERMALLLLSLMGVGVLLALVVEAHNYRGQLAFCLLGVTLIGCVGILADPTMTQRSVLSIVEKLSHFAESDYGHVFSAAWQVWQAHLWLGTGLDTYQLACEQMGVLEASRMACSHPHNLYLELGAETGLVGLGLFCGLLLAIYWAALKTAYAAKAWLHLALSASVLTVSFWPLTGGISPFSNWVGALVWLGVGWVLAVSVTPLQVQSQQTVDPAG